MCASLSAEQIDRRLKGEYCPKRKKGFRDREKGCWKKKGFLGSMTWKGSVVLAWKKTLEEKTRRAAEKYEGTKTTFCLPCFVFQQLG